MRRNRYLIPAILLVLIATLSPAQDTGITTDYDKIAHALIFFTMMINGLYAFSGSKHIAKWITACVILAILTEVFQSYIPGRSLEALDSVANLTGLLLAFLVYELFKTRINRVFMILKA